MDEKQLNDTRARVERKFRDTFDDDTLELRDNMTASDIENWDSITHIDLIVALEKEFKVRFSTADVTSLKNVGDLVALIDRKRTSG